MGKKKNKNKVKKTNPKKERYAKFRKEKTTTMTFTTPDLSDDQTVLRRQDEQKIDGFWKTYRRPPQRFISERKAKSKR